LAKKVFSNNQIDKVTSLALFLVLFHVPAWLKSTTAVDAPKNDLELLKMLAVAQKQNIKSVPVLFPQLVCAYKSKLENHLWYLSERLVPLAIFSENVHISDKVAMVRELKKHYPAASLTEHLRFPFVKYPAVLHLKDFVGPDSLNFFGVLGIDLTEAFRSPREWLRDQSNILVSNIVCVNDAAERALGLLTEFSHGKVSKNPSQKQFLFKVIQNLRQQQAQVATSSERITKKGLLSLKPN
jgi:hypothetical protein